MSFVMGFLVGLLIGCLFMAIEDARYQRRRAQKMEEDNDRG